MVDAEIEFEGDIIDQYWARVESSKLAEANSKELRPFMKALGFTKFTKRDFFSYCILGTSGLIAAFLFSIYLFKTKCFGLFKKRKPINKMRYDSTKSRNRISRRMHKIVNSNYQLTEEAQQRTMTDMSHLDDVTDMEMNALNIYS